MWLLDPSATHADDDKRAGYNYDYHPPPCGDELGQWLHTHLRVSVVCPVHAAPGTTAQGPRVHARIVPGAVDVSLHQDVRCDWYAPALSLVLRVGSQT